MHIAKTVNFWKDIFVVVSVNMYDMVDGTQKPVSLYSTPL